MVNWLTGQKILTKNRQAYSYITAHWGESQPQLSGASIWGGFFESLKHTPIPILELHALHKQYTDYPTLASKYEVGSLYKNVLFIRNIQ